jgi:hypothetical protein
MKKNGGQKSRETVSLKYSVIPAGKKGSNWLTTVGQAENPADCGLPHPFDKLCF